MLLNRGFCGAYKLFTTTGPTLVLAIMENYLGKCFLILILL